MLETIMAGALIPKLLDMFKAKGVQNISSSVVSEVADAFQEYIASDEQAKRLIMESVQQAREQDAQVCDPHDRTVNRIRALTRPAITLCGLIYYAYARINHIELSEYEYLAIGGMLTFWFGSPITISKIPFLNR